MDALKKGGAFCTEAQKLSEKKAGTNICFIHVCVLFWFNSLFQPCISF